MIKIIKGNPYIRLWVSCGSAILALIFAVPLVAMSMTWFFIPYFSCLIIMAISTPRHPAITFDQMHKKYTPS